VIVDEKNLRSRSRFFVGAAVPVIIPSTDIWPPREKMVERQRSLGVFRIFVDDAWALGVKVDQRNRRDVGDFT
jgi:hypothetical protein